MQNKPLKARNKVVLLSTDKLNREMVMSKDEINSLGTLVLKSATGIRIFTYRYYDDDNDVYVLMESAIVEVDAQRAEIIDSGIYCTLPHVKGE